MGELTKAERWVLSAVSRENRPEINTPWIQNGWLIGTDGHRAHMLRANQPDARLDSELKPIGEIEGTGIDPPNLFESSLIPVADRWETITLDTLEEQDRPDMGKGIKSLKIKAKEINKRYVVEAFDGDTKMELGISNSEKGGWAGTIRLRSINRSRQAVIMALRPFDEKEWERELLDRKARAGNTYGEKEIICPYCGYNHFDDYEAGLKGDDWLQIYCKECDNTFDCDVEVEIIFSTRRKGGKS